MLTLRCLFPLKVFPPLSFGSVQSRGAVRNSERAGPAATYLGATAFAWGGRSAWSAALVAPRLRSAARSPRARRSENLSPFPSSLPHPHPHPHPHPLQVGFLVSNWRPEARSLGRLLILGVPSLHPPFTCFSFIEKEIYTQRG